MSARPGQRLPNGVRLHWQEAGDPAGPPIVWIHGGSVEDSSFMIADLEPFFGRVRALFPDTRGHGLSRSSVGFQPRRASITKKPTT